MGPQRVTSSAIARRGSAGSADVAAMRQAYRTRGMTGPQGVQEVHELQEVQDISRPRITPVSPPATIAIPTFSGTIDP